jgi:nicotinamidase-related amidase
MEYPRKCPWHGPLPEFEFTRKNTALLIIDMQYRYAHWDYGVIRKSRDLGFEERLLYFKNRIEEIIPNIQKLQNKFREKKMEVMHARMQSLTMDGRDRSLQQKNVQSHAPPGSKEAQILEEVAPKGDEIVFSKTSSNLFNSTNIDYVLRNIGIECLVFVGVVTNGCVESAARDAPEKGYYTIVVEDACGAHSEELHRSGIIGLSESYANIKKTKEILEAVEQL